jgi:hypothetical protein
MGIRLLYVNRGLMSTLPQVVGQAFEPAFSANAVRLESLTYGEHIL